MKVRVTVDVDVDPDTWMDVYGVSGSDVLRDVVRSYVLNLVAGSPAADEDAITDVRLT